MQCDKRHWLRLACHCVSEAAQQLSGASLSVDEDRAYVEKATSAVIPSEVDLSNSRLAVADAQALATVLRHSPHVQQLDVSQCGMMADHCQALGGGLTSVKVLKLNGNGGLHEDRGLEALSQAIVNLGAPRLSVLHAKYCSLNVDDCTALRLLVHTVTSLRRLSIGENTIGTAGLLTVQPSLCHSKLQLLAVSQNGLDSGAGRILAGIVEVNPHLVELHARNNLLGNRGVQDLLKGVVRSHSLQCVNLTDNRVDDNVIGSVSACLEHRIAHRAKTLAYPLPLTLCLHGNRVSRMALEELASNSPGSGNDRVECGPVVVEGRSIKKREYRTVFEQHAKHGKGGDLRLCGQGIDDDSAEKIAIQLSEDRIVKAVNLADNAIGDRGAAALGEAMQVNSALCGMSLARNRVGPAGFASIATRLTASPCMIQLISLRGNPLLPDDAQHVGVPEALGKLIGLSNLCCLSLTKTGVGDKECQLIGEALALDRCSMSFLLLAGNGITDSGADALSSGLQKNTSVKFLDLSHNRISDAGCERLGLSLDYRAKLGIPVRTVWMAGNAADPAAYTGSMVNATVNFWSIEDFMKTYLCS